MSSVNLMWWLDGRSHRDWICFGSNPMSSCTAGVWKGQTILPNFAEMPPLHLIWVVFLHNPLLQIQVIHQNSVIYIAELITIKIVIYMFGS
jgi:hypothetical protein